MSKQYACNRHGGTFETSPACKFGEVSKARRHPKTRRKPPLPDAGTIRAISNSLIGVAANLPCSTGRGGARNSAYRESHALSDAQVGSLIAATDHAGIIGLPFNRMMTIHWEAAGIPLAAMPKATGRFIDLMTKLLARHGCQTAWVWVHEGGAGKGGHCHLLAHVPAELVPALMAKQKRWLRSITGSAYRAKVIHSDPIGGRLGLEWSNPDLHAVNLAVVLGYVLKGAGPDTAAKFGLERLEPGGFVIGKRCGASQNIGPSARKAHAALAHSAPARAA